MTITEAIARIDSLKPNRFSEIDKIYWLNELDGKIKAEVIDTHEGSELVQFEPYNDKTKANKTELIVKQPHENIYILWLETKIDYYNAEYTRYNNSSIAFNSAYMDFVRAYHKDHKPKPRKLKFF
jgi:hypothetical protein